MRPDAWLENMLSPSTVMVLASAKGVNHSVAPT